MSEIRLSQKIDFLIKSNYIDEFDSYMTVPIAMLKDWKSEANSLEIENVYLYGKIKALECMSDVEEESDE